MEDGGKRSVWAAIAALPPTGIAVFQASCMATVCALLLLFGDVGTVAVATTAGVGLALTGATFERYRDREAKSPCFRGLPYADRRRVLDAVHCGATDIPHELAPAVAEQARIIVQALSRRQRTSRLRVALYVSAFFLAILYGLDHEFFPMVVWLTFAGSFLLVPRSEARLRERARCAWSAAEGE